MPRAGPLVSDNDTQITALALPATSTARIAQPAGEPRSPAPNQDVAGRLGTAGYGGPLITAVEVIPYSLPYRQPIRFASGAIDAADHVLVRVHTDGGVTGHAEAQPRPYTYGESQESIVTAVRDQLAPRIIGHEVLSTERIEARCAEVEGQRVARGAIDLAVWDAAAQLLELPCAVLLGGYAPDVAVAYMISFGEPARMAADATNQHEALGINAFKIKTGRNPDLDLACARAVRDALPEAELYVDANRGWSSPAEALRAVEGLLELGVTAVEEPIDIQDSVGRRRLARAWQPVPLVGDESCISLHHVNRALDEGAVGLVSVKTARTGFTESRRILALCAGRGVPATMGSQYEGALGALATLHFAAAHAAVATRPAEIANFTTLADDIVVSAPTVFAGRARVPAGPGLGAEIDEDKLARYRLDA